MFKYCHLERQCVPLCTGVNTGTNFSNSTLHFDNSMTGVLTNVGLSTVEYSKMLALQCQNNYTHEPLQLCHIWDYGHFPYRKPDYRIFEDYNIVFNPIGISVDGPTLSSQRRFCTVLEMAQLDLLLNFPRSNDMGRSMAFGGFPWNGLQTTFIMEHYRDYNCLLLELIRFTNASDWLIVSFSFPV